MSDDGWGALDLAEGFTLVTPLLTRPARATYQHGVNEPAVPAAAVVTSPTPVTPLR